MPDTPPSSIGKYLLTDLLGQGAMGVVYRALDPVLNRHVAIKLMGQSLASDTQLRDRFMREAQAAGSLQHPNIITIYDFGESDGHLFIAMEYVEGADLSEIMERGDALTLPQKLDILIDVLHALQYAHARHVVHRDIKPANIRVGTDGRAKLMDFGIARLESSELTKTGMLIGTPNYMAPEQVNGGQVSPATDIFSLGAVLYEFLSGRKSFGGDTLHSVLYKVVSEQPPPLQTLLPGCPRELQRIVDKALAKEPAERYPHAAQMAEELSAVRASLSGGGAVTIAARRTPLANSLVVETPPAAATAASARVPLTGSMMIGGGLLAIAAVGAIYLFGRREAPISSSPPQVVVTPPGTVRRDTLLTTPPGQSPPPTAPARTPERSLPAPTRANTVFVQTAAPAQPQPEPAAAQPAQQSAPAPQVQAPAPATAPAPAPAVTQAPATPEPPRDPRPDIEQLVASYARAIESRSVAEIRRVYPGLTARQQQGWEQFFPSVRNLRARLAITRLDMNGATAELQVTGAYEFEGSSGRAERQPASFGATAVLEAGAWKLRAVR